MNPDKIAVMHQCGVLSLAGQISFPDVVHRLSEIGVERYHADLCREENTYYFPDGESHVEPMPHGAAKIAEGFSAPAVEQAIRTIQRGEIVYREFLDQIMSAGCVGYFVQITGRRAQYFGGKGEIHHEPFPSVE